MYSLLFVAEYLPAVYGYIAWYGHRNRTNTYSNCILCLTDIFHIIIRYRYVYNMYITIKYIIIYINIVYWIHHSHYTQIWQLYVNTPPSQLFVSFSQWCRALLLMYAIWAYIILSIGIYMQRVLYLSCYKAQWIFIDNWIFICSSNTNLVLFVLYCQTFCQCLMVYIASLPEWMVRALP